ncbi:MAG: FAD-linked oxidase C-terminal domain-containing protein [Gammaproteobacteria bacterium]
MSALHERSPGGDPPRVEPARLAAALREILPGHSVLTGDEAIAPFECDGLSAYRQRPAAVVLPETVDQVQALLRRMSALGVPVVTRGAGTGLSGGALPLAEAVLLVMTRFDRILSVDPANRCAIVQPGVTNAAISEAVRTHGLYYAPDPSSQIACSIGGNVAENAGGVHCLKYGLTVNNVRSLEIVTVDGERLRLGSAALDGPGFDLTALLTGSEGMLGVITEVTVDLLPLPPGRRVLLAAFDSVRAAGDAVATIIAAGIVPAGLEMMDAPAIRAAEAFCQAGYPEDAAAMLLCELDGVEDDVIEEASRVRRILESHGARDLREAVDEAEQVRLWQGRKSAFPAVGRIAPDYYCMDGTIPRREIARVLEGIDELAAKHGLAVANVFHAGDGNLHPLILYDVSRPGDLEKAERLGGEILELCVKAGGTITGEHGVGKEKIDQMCVQFSPQELAAFHGIKAAFDPRGLLNPGKAVPTLARCAELGGMHVHGGALPHPELERF